MTQTVDTAGLGAVTGLKTATGQAVVEEQWPRHARAEFGGTLRNCVVPIDRSVRQRPRTKSSGGTRHCGRPRCHRLGPRFQTATSSTTTTPRSSGSGTIPRYSSDLVEAGAAYGQVSVDPQQAVRHLLVVGAQPGGHAVDAASYNLSYIVLALQELRERSVEDSYLN